MAARIGTVGGHLKEDRMTVWGALEKDMQYRGYWGSELRDFHERFPVGTRESTLRQKIIGGKRKNSQSKS